VEIVIFRFDRMDLERALQNAVERGVSVRALIAYTNRGGERNLRKLELRFLAAGITVARTANDLVRYHGKMMLVDRKELHLLAFNLTHLDIDHSRSFALVTQNRQLTREAARLFDCDSKRRTYKAGCSNFLVSPANARKELAAFIKGARKELLIYDLKISDRQMIRLLEERANAGVSVRIIGKLTRRSNGLQVEPLKGIRLHARVMIRDGRHVFMGSQSMRELELDARREIGLIVGDAKIAGSLTKVFEADWNHSGVDRKVSPEPPIRASRVAKKVARSLTNDLPAVAPVVQQVIKKSLDSEVAPEIDSEMLEETVKDAVRQAVQDVVESAVESVAEAPAEAK
jgi:phosphatidylserine/phosphatidylglycerophosphate/cardiolipin synthase-like enzyme